MIPEAERRIAWVTGAGKGIGRAVARRLAGDGWTVAVSARTAGDLEALARECPPDRIRCYPADMTEDGQVLSVVQRIEGELGPIALALLNAGTHRPVSAASFSSKPFRLLVETNLMGTVHCLAALLPVMRGRRAGQIAVVASVAGYRGLPSAAAYGASKAALINMCEALQPELARDGVRFNLVNPGFVETPLTDRNDFPMPFLIGADEAAESIVRGLQDGTSFEIAFPWRMAWLMKLLRILPDRLFFAVSRRMLRS